MDSEIIFITGGVDMLDDVQGLWEELNLLHLEKSPYFKQHHRDLTFQARKKSFLHCAEKGELFVATACHKNMKIGYCIASAVDDAGEIESIYINPDYRKHHVGSRLMETSLEWLKSKNVHKTTVKVSFGNEEAYGFYEKYGFAPRLTELQLAQASVAKAPDNTP